MVEDFFSSNDTRPSPPPPSPPPLDVTHCSLVRTRAVHSDESGRSNGSMWEGCGTVCTKSMVTYFAQLFIALLVIGLCMSKLITTTMESERTMYLSTMMSVVAYFMPHPQLKSK